MGVRQDRQDAVTTLIATQRAQIAVAETVMAAVSADSITAQNITDLNAAIAAIKAALVASNAALRAE